MSDNEAETKKGKGDDGKKSKLRASAMIVMIEELYNDIRTTLQTVRLSKDLSKIRLQTFQRSADSDLESANKYHRNIVGSTRLPAEDLQRYLESKMFKFVKETYWLITAEINERLDAFPKEAVTSDHSKDCSSDFNLPPIDIPSFSGKYEEWLPFHNLFMSSVHPRKNLQPVQKLHYLMKTVTGDAYNQIKNLSLVDANYNIALHMLEEQYNHTRKVAHTYMRKLLECKALTTENAKDLRDFISNTKDCLVSLKSLGLPTDNWDYILLYNLQSKIPSTTYMKWEEHLGASREIPKFNHFLEFLETRFRTLEMIEVPSNEKDGKKIQKTLHTKSKSAEKPINLTQKKGKPQSQAQSSADQKKKFSKTVSCVICKQGHATAHCNQFKNNTPAVRRQLASQYNLCFNCLGSSHKIDVCFSTKTCNYCHEHHHSLLHLHDFTNSNPGTSAQSSQERATQQYTHYASSDPQSVRILGTALIRIVNSSGYTITVRALLDSGADDNYIINSAVQSAGLSRYSAAAAISGLNDVNLGSTEHKVNFQIQSLDGTFQFDSSASVVENITSKMPSQYVEPENFGFLNNLQLADPHFNHPGKIQILLGVGFIVKIRKPGIKKFKDLLAEQTLLGWVVMGQCCSESSNTLLTRNVFLSNSIKNEDLSKQIQKFFEIEEFSEIIPQKPEDALCEKKFKDSVQRGSDGKLTVGLPFREDCLPLLGASKHIALRRFLNLEKKLENNPALKEEYSKTFTDYLEQGHMLPVTVTVPQGYEYFLPHHAVFKDSSSTTKVRVVFDGSCKTADSTSLNDHLLTGPKLQTDIRDIIFNWRQYKFALTADIAKMYRMFWVTEEHRNYQKVLWRFSKDQPISEYCLATVTFGTSSAPFQAIRALHYIAEREGLNYPLASRALLNEFFVDDFISGAHSIVQAIQKQTELREVLNQYGLNIRKWSSNSVETLKGVDPEHRETLTELCFEEEEFKKTLGVFWAPRGDFFSFSTSQFINDKQVFTKRTILSLIARLYDPMGWVGPCTLHAKMIMQRIWEQNLDWDEEVCGSIRADFEDFLQDLHQLTKIKLPRWIEITDDEFPVTLYGFSDASLKAYGSVLYLRNPDITDKRKLLLLTSRTRVKPLKHVTLARLELNAAVMLAELIQWAKTLFKPKEVKVRAFSDSQIVLSWLRSHPSRWKMYVAGRTTKILESTSPEEWAYVNTKHNPADFASRGLMPSDLISNSLWWNGPSLDDLETSSCQPELSKEEKEVIQTETKEPKPVYHVQSSSNSIVFLLEKYSSNNKLCRVMGYITAFLTNILLKLKSKRPTQREVYELMIQRLSLDSENQIFRQVQEKYFAPEIKSLQTRSSLPKNTKLGSLYPFLDGFGVLRVGGRLQNSNISYDQKHPIILPSHHQVTTNLIHHAHRETLHGTNKLTVSYLQNKFHILRCADRVKVLLRCCPICIRFARTNHEQLMGSLPENRVNPHRAFLCTGVDYAGPFTVKAYKGRCKKVLKKYVALFICFATKAIHLELVSELTAVAFLAAFRRFVGRRGHCQMLYSDCGTNFVKGNKLLQDEVHKAQQSWKTELSIDFDAMKTTWKFNPPGTPHFGGIWEAGVKSVKTHLFKTVGTTILTEEELNTLLVQIESILNSRPLCPLSTDPNEFYPLTPGHFLIGESFVSPPNRSFELEAKHPVDRWQNIQKLRQTFWDSWKKEYLHRLNVRPKWKFPGIEYKKNDLVLLTDENTPPTHWPTAIVVETHPGKDGITRVVTLKTNKGQLFKRPTSKLRLLAYNSDDVQQINPAADKDSQEQKKYKLFLMFRNSLDGKENIN